MTNLTRWDPFRDMVSLRDAMDRLLKDSFVRPSSERLPSTRAGGLALDMYETEDDVVVETDLPGVDPEDVDISITGTTLSMKAETEGKEEVERDHYIYRERRFGSFTRSVSLPVPVESDEAEAEYNGGVLKLRLPKVEEAKPKAIEVQVKQ